MPEPGQGQLDNAEVRMIALNLIADAEDAARLSYPEDTMQELSESMAAMGQLVPISVFPVGKGYQVLEGQRRLMCARDLGWRSLRCEIVTDKNLAIEAIRLHSNQVRVQMTAWEEAIYFSNLVEREKLDFEQVCKWVRKSPEYVSKRLFLLKLQPETIEALKTDRIPLGVALQLYRVKDRKWQLYWLDVVLRSGTGTGVLTGWVSDFLRRGGLEQRAQPTDTPVVVTEPPKPVDFPCCLCDHPHGGRQMMQVWIHADELSLVRQVLSMQFNAMAEQAEAEQLTAEAQKGPEKQESGSKEQGA